MDQRKSDVLSKIEDKVDRRKVTDWFREGFRVKTEGGVGRG